MSQPQTTTTTTTTRTTTRPAYYSGTTEPKTANPDRKFITVEVQMPHLAKYGKPVTQVLTYGFIGEVHLGQIVLCPPTRLNPKWSKGRVVALDAGGYSGRVKYATPLGRRKR